MPEKWISEVMKGLKQFFYQGSLHGVKYIFEPSFGSKEKATWVIIMFISIFICAVVIIQLFCKWTSTPFVNVIDSMPTPIWAVPFPTVVICPHLHVKMSYANVTELEGLQEFFAAMVCPRMTNEIKYRETRLDDSQFHMLTEFVVKVSIF
ncbi:uncharacterized protein LOC124636058 [Helicoverpa zea]|uniref:uncharacterized protein LOC124636058 n=1 Tax=Helicoverpa zea TaxID=7113 RepID=UPI001F593504|nr:uncharacterized protein LOC124636058 [Helicoverpa zea]